jgi:hypothetical protein
MSLQPFRKRGFGDDYSYSESPGSSSYNSAAVEDGDDSFVDSDVSDDMILRRCLIICMNVDLDQDVISHNVY